MDNQDRIDTCRVINAYISKIEYSGDFAACEKWILERAFQLKDGRRIYRTWKSEDGRRSYYDVGVETFYIE